MAHRVVPHVEWLEARKQLLAKEKEFTRLRDELSQQRRELPWEAVEKNYSFEGPDGQRTLAQLFAGKSQLVVYHAMFAPGATAACKHCSFWMDSFQGALIHLRQRDVTLVAVSRAPYASLAAYAKRMGWTHPWYSAGDSSFNYDFGASFTTEQLKAPVYNYGRTPENADREGVSVLHALDGKIFHTYSSYARGIDLLNVTYNYLDIVPKGRDEGERGPYWVRRHDEYES